MVQLHVPSATAQRLWALPGAMIWGRRPVFENGVVRLGSEPVAAPCPSYLIEHAKGLVLFDAGLSPKGLDDPVAYFGIMAQLYRMEFTPELALDAQLRQLGYALEDVSYVVPSHLHFDHAGGLYLFPDATFFVGAGELSYAYWPPPGHRRAFLVADLLPTRDFDWVELGADHDLFGDGSIVILSTPGHTPGEVSLLVRLPSRTLILTGDTCHFCMELDRGMAAIDIPCSDPAQAGRSIRRIRSMRRSLPAEVWVGHDPDHWAQFPHAPEALV